MSAQVFLSQQSIAGSRSRFSQDPINSRRAANESFNHARKKAARRALFARLTRKSIHLLSVNAGTGAHQTTVSSGIKNIVLDDIIGSEGRSEDFDDQFWPLKEHNRDRWVNIAQAMAAGKPLPPIQLVKTEAGYVVRDGHHRLSVARAIGRQVIEAEIQ